eukprot:scaffold84092_cov45-Phaeocystis_antarctica.AAC.1
MARAEQRRGPPPHMAAPPTRFYAHYGYTPRCAARGHAPALHPLAPPQIPLHPLTGAPHVAARLPRPPLLGAANRAAALAEKGTQR